MRARSRAFDVRPGGTGDPNPFSRLKKRRVLDDGKQDPFDARGREGPLPALISSQKPCFRAADYPMARAESGLGTRE